MQLLPRCRDLTRGSRARAAANYFDTEGYMAPSLFAKDVEELVQK